jgi:hypothetical protein
LGFSRAGQQIFLRWRKKRSALLARAGGGTAKLFGMKSLPKAGQGKNWHQSANVCTACRKQRVFPSALAGKSACQQELHKIIYENILFLDEKAAAGELPRGVCAFSGNFRKWIAPIWQKVPIIGSLFPETVILAIPQVIERLLSNNIDE